MVELRRFYKYDDIAYFRIAQDKRSYFPFGFCKTLEEAGNIIDYYMSEELKAYAITQNNKLVGVIYAEVKKCNNYAEVSYFIGKEFQRNGYATQALKLMEQILSKMDIAEIRFVIDVNNIASVKTATKFGAKFYKRIKNLNYYTKKII